MKKSFKKLAGLLAVLMLLSVSVTAFAQVDEDPEGDTSSMVEIDEEGEDEDVTEPEEPEEGVEGEGDEDVKDPEDADPENPDETEEPEEPEEPGEETPDPETPEEPEEPVDAEGSEGPVAEEPEDKEPEKQGSLVTPMVIRDNTPPALKTVSGTATTTLPGKFKLDLDLVEDGFGVTNIYVVFINEEGYTFGATWDATDASPLWTGKHTVELESTSWNYSHTGVHTISSISLTDGATNYVNYDTWMSTKEGELVCRTDESVATTSAKVTVTNVKEYTAKLNSLSLKKSKLDLPGTLPVEIDFTTDSPGLSSISISLVKLEASSDGTYEVGHLSWSQYLSNDGELLKSGKHTINFEVDEYDFTTGNYRIQSISLNAENVTDAYYAYDEYEDKYRSIRYGNEDLLNIKDNKIAFTSNPAAPDDVTAPVIKSAKINTPVVSSPGVLEVEFDLVEDGSGLSTFEMNMQYDMTNGGTNYQYVSVNFDKPLKTGKHTVQFAIDNMFVANLEHKVVSIYAVDQARNYTQYSFYEEDGVYSNRLYAAYRDQPLSEFKGPMKFKIGDVEKGTVFSTLNHPKLLDDIKNMADGATAYINFDMFGGDTVAPKALFEAIAGTNKILVFQSETVQWVFAGKNIDSAKIKDLDLYVVVYNDVMEEQFGDEEVVITYFKNEGDLPGPAEIRFANETLLERYGDGSTFYLTHFDGDDTQRETVEVKLGGDGVFGYTITHNSYFVLSGAKPLTEGVAYPGEGSGSSDSGSGSGSGGSKSAIAATGDASSPLLYLVIALVAVSAAGVAVWRKKRTA